MRAPLAVLFAVVAVNCGTTPTAPTPSAIVTPPPASSASPPTAPPVTPPPAPTPPPPAPAAPFPPNDARFNLTLYRQLVHNALDGPVQPLRRFTQAPRIYLRTIDEDGKPIDGRMLNETAKALEESAGEMTGKFGLAGLERGTESRIGQPGWLTVRWLPQAANPQRICGQARVGVEGSTLDLFPYQAFCSCAGYGMAPRIVRHELGHALGFWHTDRGDDLMYGGNWHVSFCNIGMSQREIFHAALAYDRPIGSTAP